MIWVGHVAYMEMRKAYKSFGGKPERKTGMWERIMLKLILYK
jgi:hypothetical protein